MGLGRNAYTTKIPRTIKRRTIEIRFIVRFIGPHSRDFSTAVRSIRCNRRATIKPDATAALQTAKAAKIYVLALTTKGSRNKSGEWVFETHSDSPNPSAN